VNAKKGRNEDPGQEGTLDAKERSVGEQRKGPMTGGGIVVRDEGFLGEKDTCKRDTKATCAWVSVTISWGPDIELTR